MSGFEDSHIVGEVGARRDTNTANLCSKRIGDVVTVQVKGCNYAVLVWTQDNLLQHGVGNHIFNHNIFASVGILNNVPWTAIEWLGAKLFAGHFIAPVTKSTFGELHNVALVDKSDGGLVLVDGVLDSFADQALGALGRNRLNADTAVLVKTDLGNTHLLFEELDYLVRILGTRFPLDTCVDIFGVFAEDAHINLVWLFNR